MSNKSDGWVVVGVVGAPHGVKGAVHVTTALEDPKALKDYNPLTLADGRALRVSEIKSRKGAQVVAIFETIATRDAAKALTHQKLLVARDRLPALKGEDFYHADLIGLSAVTASGEEIGKVAAVHNFGAGDVLEIQGKGELMVAFTKAFVPKVDLEKKIIVIRNEAAE